MRTEKCIYYAIKFNYRSNGMNFEYVAGNLYSTKEEAEKAIDKDWEALKSEGEELISADIKYFYPVQPIEEEQLTEEEIKEAWQSLGDAFVEAMEEING